MSIQNPVTSENQLILTIRFIRSFQHHNLKNLVIRNVDPNATIKDFKLLINEGNKFQHVTFPLAFPLNFNRLRIAKEQVTGPIQESYVR
jgi:hypothetical protein